LATDSLLACATLGLGEVIATISRKRKAGQLTTESSDAILLEIEKDWIDFAQIQLLPDVVTQATASAQSFSLRGADAIHLASVLFIQKQMDGTEDQLFLVTSDQELKTAALASRIIVLDPTDEPPLEIVPSDESEIKNPKS
jgi:predicted nucleic acid-binding protein